MGNVTEFEKHCLVLSNLPHDKISLGNNYGIMVQKAYGHKKVSLDQM